MSLQSTLAEYAIGNHPGRAATVLERLDAGASVELLGRGPVSNAVGIVQRLSPQHATLIISGMKPERAAQLLELMPIDAAVRLLRRIDEPLQGKLIDLFDPKKVRAIRLLLGFREGTAGALMDPDALALPQDLSARDALQRIRKQADATRYNLYVVDQEQRLTGAFNLRELLSAPGRTPLFDLMVRDPYRITATTDRISMLSNPGWKRAHSLPVVDADDAYLGAIRYRTLREVEDELLSARRDDADTGAAFGQVIAAAAGGVLDALGGAADTNRGRKDGA